VRLALLIHRLLRIASLGLELGQGGLLRLQPLLSSRQGLLRLGQLLAAVDEALLVGCHGGVAIGQQALLAGLELAVLFFDAALLSGQHANGLLHLRHRAGLLRGTALGFAQRIFQRRQLLSLFFSLGSQNVGLLCSGFVALGQFAQLDSGLLCACGPALRLFSQLL